MGSTVFVDTLSAQPLELDHGDELTVLEAELERYRQALRALRQAMPGIVVDGKTHVIAGQTELDLKSKYNLIHDLLFRADLGLYKSGARWLSPQERASVDAAMKKP